MIRRDLGSMTRNERRAAQRLLADYPVAGLSTTASFGAAAGVSAPTVLRMIAKLGFDSYSAFQEALRAELAARLATPLMKGAEAPPTGKRGDWLERFADAATDNIRETAAYVARPEFDAVAKLLADVHRPVHVLGGRFTAPLADYFVAHLRVMRPKVRRIEGSAMNWHDQLLDMGKRDTAVILDIRRYAAELAAFAEKAAKRGTCVVLLTDQWLSPVSRVAKHVLPAHVAAPSIWDSSVGLMLLIESLLAAVADTLGPATRRRLSAIEAMRGN
jgi:DNA-binding MurR/RpiR family transcriptional regulator